LEAAQEKSKEAFDVKRTAKEFEVGQWVLLATTNYYDQNEKSRPVRKLRAKYMGPYKITAVDGVNVTLDMPED
jgi:hypothetical protein